MVRKLLTILVASLLHWLPNAAHARDRDAPQIKHRPCTEYTSGQAYEVRVRIVDRSNLFDPKIIYRTGKSQWRNLTLLEAGRYYRAVIPAVDLDGELEYFIEAFDIHGNGPGRYGTAASPAVLRPAESATHCNQFRDDKPPRVERAAPAPVSEVTSEPEPKPASQTRTEPKSRVSSATKPERTRPDSSLMTTKRTAPAASGCAGASPPLHCKGWFWGLVVGVVVAAVVTGVAVGVSGAGAEPVEDVTVYFIGPGPAQSLVRW